MFTSLYLNWSFTIGALMVAPGLFLVVYYFTHRIKKASLAVRGKEGQVVNVLEEVLSSIRVVKAFAREDCEQKRFGILVRSVPSMLTCPPLRSKVIHAQADKEVRAPPSTPALPRSRASDTRHDRLIYP